MKKTTTLDMGEISRAELIAFFENLKAVHQADQSYQGPNWQAEVGPETLAPLGSLFIRRVKVHIDGDEVAVNDLVTAIRQAFMRCGG